MSDQLKFKFIPCKDSNTGYDYFNVDTGDERVGKVRAMINGRTLTIFSINVFLDLRLFREPQRFAKYLSIIRFLIYLNHIFYM